MGQGRNGEEVREVEVRLCDEVVRGSVGEKVE
jgi:hypothetical protein